MMNAGLATTPAEEVPHEGFQDNTEPQRRDPRPQAETPATVVINDDQRRILMDLAANVQVDARTLSKKCGVDSVPAIPAAMFAKAETWLRAKLTVDKPVQQASPQASDIIDDDLPY